MNSIFTVVDGSVDKSLTTFKDAVKVAKKLKGE
jgi:hypothetical protein